MNINTVYNFQINAETKGIRKNLSYLMQKKTDCRKKKHMRQNNL